MNSLETYERYTSVIENIGCRTFEVFLNALKPNETLNDVCGKRDINLYELYIYEFHRRTSTPSRFITLMTKVILDECFMLRFDSVITALITPFTSDGKLFVEGVRNLLEYQLNEGVKAFFICGTYGLGPLMTVAERRKVTELVMEYVGGKGFSSHIG